MQEAMTKSIGRVFITQNVLMRNRQSGEMEAKFDLSKAEKYGELYPLLLPGQDMISTVPVVRTLREKLWDFTDDDYLLLLGDPALIAAAAAIAAERNDGRFKILKFDRGWDPVKGRTPALDDYIPVQIDISGKAL